MFLFATWESEGSALQEGRRWQTPFGPAFANLRTKDSKGTAAVGVDVRTPDRYIEPHKYCALGALAFWNVPEIRGVRTELKLVAVPAEWISASSRIVGVLAHAGLKARIVDSAMMIEHPSIAPSLLIRRTALALYALDSFTRSQTPKSLREAIRLEAIKAFRVHGDELLALMDDGTGAPALRSLLSADLHRVAAPKPAPRIVASAQSAPEIQTRLGRTVRIGEKEWSETLDTFSRWTVDRRWLFYVPPGMCSVQTTDTGGPLEHPRAALDYYRNEGLERVVVEFKHMGSRAIVVVCRDESAAMRRFGCSETGSVHTRNGRPFFDDPSGALGGIREGLTRANFWEQFKTDWVCLDGEYLPWTAKALRLLEGTHGEVLRSGEAMLREMIASELLPVSERSRVIERQHRFIQYGKLIEHYRAEEETKLRFAPFQIIATEGRSYFNRSHGWQMGTLARLVERAGDPFLATPHQSLALHDSVAAERCFAWWDELTATGNEGLVVKAPYCVTRGRRGLAQPALKCRTAEHLRFVYGPEYDLVENRWELASRDALQRRREKHRRVLKQQALSVEGVERFLRNEPVGSVENCVRAILSFDR